MEMEMDKNQRIITAGGRIDMICQNVPQEDFQYSEQPGDQEEK